MNYYQAQSALKGVYDQIKGNHGPEGHRYIQTHWTRYVNLLTLLPPLGSQSRVLEIGASMLSSTIRRLWGCEVHTIHHELEPQWPDIYKDDGNHVHACELARDPLPVSDSYFDCILFDEVLEHLPLSPEYLVRQIIMKLKPDGVLLLSVPNFATSRRRLWFLFGKNPQDVMDPRFVYFAHHREPVRNEVLDIVKNSGGDVLECRMSDFSFKAAIHKKIWWHLRQLAHGNPHQLIHLLFPSTRDYIIVKVRRVPGYVPAPGDIAPPLRSTGEFIRHA